MSNQEPWYQQQPRHLRPVHQASNCLAALLSEYMSCCIRTGHMLIFLGVAHCSCGMVLETQEIKKSDGCKCVVQMHPSTILHITTTDLNRDFLSQQHMQR